MKNEEKYCTQVHNEVTYEAESVFYSPDPRMTWLRITVRSRSRDPTQQRFPELLARERADIIIGTQ